MSNYAWLFILAGLISFVLERQTNSGCKETPITLLISFLHHYGSMYLTFGSVVFGNHALHLLSLIIVVTLWTINKTCYVTTVYNKLCNIYTNRPFHDVFFLVNEYLQVPYFRYILATLVLLYDLKHII